MLSAFGGLMKIVRALLYASLLPVAMGVIGLSARRAATGVVTFEKEIAPIFDRKCRECHQTEGMAPMSLMTYKEARPWAKAILEQVITRQMPPFYAAGPRGYYENDIRLTQEEIKLISDWVDTGAGQGTPSSRRDETEPAAPVEAPVPDLIMKPPLPYRLPGDGVDHFELFAFDRAFEAETWIRGINVRPGNRAMVHHVTVYILPEHFKAGPDGRVPGAEAMIMGAQPLLFWNPGSGPRMFRPQSALSLPKGARLGMQIHYAPTTVAGMTDHTSVEIYFADGKIDQIVRVLYGYKVKIEIPPGADDYRLTDYRRFQTDALISGFSSHMHLRGKSFVIRLRYPDGRIETVFDVPQFRFNWQRNYTLTRDLSVQQGTVAEYIAVYDNSAKNRFNPDPLQAVRFGFNSSDEMMAGSIVYVNPHEKLGLQIRHGAVITGKQTAPTSER
jgi:hypothetical protein